MKDSTDYFDLAVKNTFAKASKIPCWGTSVSFKTVNEKNEIKDETLTSKSALSNTLGFINDKPSDYFSCTNVDMVEDPFYAAVALEEMENIRKLKLNDCIHDRIRKMMILEEEFKDRMNANLLLTNEEISIKERLMWKMSESCISDDDLTASRKFSALLKRYSDLKVKENKGALCGKNTKFKNLNDEADTSSQKIELSKMKADFTKLNDKISEDLNSCCNCSKLITLAGAELKKIQEFKVGIKNILQTEVNAFNDNDAETCRIILHWLSLLAENLKGKIELINEEVNKTKALNEQLDPVISEETSSEETVLGKHEEKNAIYDYICRQSVEDCSKLEDNLTKISRQVEEFVTNTSSKGFIRNLKIAINTPVNALSSLNAQHVQDKFRKITDLLHGKFTFPNAEISDSTKALYFPFLIDFLCKKLISQGENMLIPSKPEDAFVLASIIVAIWIDFPEFGSVLLAYFMKRCPYTIPAYWPQYKGQSEEDFYSSRGYQYKHDGTMEDQNSFLKRMTGIFMLYVAIMVSIPRGNQPHPYGLKNAWKWLAATINLEPRPDITATLLFVFLDMVGYKMSQYYGRQFWKIMQLINSEYMTKIEQVASSDFCGPVSRLKEYIAKVLRDGRFSEPKGILPANYW